MTVLPLSSSPATHTHCYNQPPDRLQRNKRGSDPTAISSSTNTTVPGMMCFSVHPLTWAHFLSAVLQMTQQRAVESHHSRFTSSLASYSSIQFNIFTPVFLCFLSELNCRKSQGETLWCAELLLCISQHDTRRKDESRHESQKHLLYQCAAE